MRRCDIPMSHKEADEQGLDVGGQGYAGRPYVNCPRPCAEGYDVCEEHLKVRLLRAQKDA